MRIGVGFRLILLYNLGSEATKVQCLDEVRKICVRRVKFEFQLIRGEAESYCPKDWGSVFNRKRVASHQEQV